MYADTVSRVLSQIVLLSGLLVGFSITGIVGLVSMRDQSRTTSAVIGAFLASATLLLYAAMVGTLTLAYPLETLASEQFARMARVYPLLQWPFRLGLLSFLTGIGLAGWTRSKRLGLLSTVLAAIVLLGWLSWGLFMRGLFGR